MDIQTNLAAQSYAQLKPATAAVPQTAAAGMAGLIGSFADTLARGEDIARAAMTGKADPHALVQALADSQLAIETAVTLRDKVVEAYQEILRMPV